MKNVVVLGTGSVSSIAIRCAHSRPDMKVVGVWAHKETAGDKIGTDAGLLYGETPIGVTITGDLDELVAMKPDGAFFGLNPSHDSGNAVLLPMMEKFLLAGTCVVGSSIAYMMFPDAPTPANEEAKAVLGPAAAKGKAALYIAGIEPGFVCDQLLVTMLTGSNSVKQVRSQEIAMYDTYPPEHIMKNTFGFGMPVDFVCEMEKGEGLISAWGPAVCYTGKALGYDNVSTQANIRKSSYRQGFACCMRNNSRRYRRRDSFSGHWRYRW